MAKQVALAQLGLEDKKVALILPLAKLPAHVMLIVLKAVATNVKDNRLFANQCD